MTGTLPLLGPTSDFAARDWLSGTIPLVTIPENHLTIYDNRRSKPNKDRALAVETRFPKHCFRFTRVSRG